MCFKNQFKMRAWIQSILALFFFISVAELRLVDQRSQHIYKLNKIVSVDHVNLKNSKEISYNFVTNLRISSIWHSESDQFLKIEFLNPTLSSAEQTKQLDKISQWPFYISFKDGQPYKVIAAVQRDQTLLNLIRAIASLFQIQYESGPGKETDISGQCTVLYRMKSSTKIEKTKTDCSNWDLRVRFRTEKVFGVIRKSQQITNYDLTSEGYLLRADASEEHKLLLGINSDIGSYVSSKFMLEHINDENVYVEPLNSTLDEVIKGLLEWHKIYDLEADVDDGLNENNNRYLEKDIMKYTELLSTEAIGTHEAAVAFSQLLPLARIAKKEEFVTLLTKYKELHPQLVDLLGAVQTIESHSAINEIFDYNNDEHWEMIEKYLQSLAVGTFTEHAIIEELFKRVNNEIQIKNIKLYDTLLQTTAALIQRSIFDDNDEIKLNFITLAVHNINEKCTNSECKVLFIRALENLNEPKTIDTLLKHAETGNKIVSVAAMRALKSFLVLHFNRNHRNTFWQIFFQLKRRYDSSVRVYAFDILMALNVTPKDVEHLLEYLQSSDRQFEVKTYVIQKMQHLAEKCSKFKAILKAVLSQSPHINNYNILAHKGLTTVFMRQLSTKPAFNESLLSVQEIEYGVLKRGSVDLVLSADQEETSNFKLGLFSSGLNSFVSEEVDADMNDDNEESAVTAGIELSVQGIALRPLIFFEGQAELMGHVWSGTASEPTLVYLATVLEQNQEQFVILSSGATVHGMVIGAKSVDLNGRVELSLWNRNAQVDIEHNSGIGVVGKIITGWKNHVELRQEYLLTSEPNLGLKTNVDFYSKIKLCMQLHRPQTNLTMHYTKKSVFINDKKRFHQNVERKQVNVLHGKTLHLNQKNNDMCNEIFSSH